MTPRVPGRSIGPMRTLILLLALALAACASEPPSGARCEIGRSVACMCPSLAMGTQECSPAGVYEVCRCFTGDGGPDAVVGLDVAVPDVVAVVDAAAEASADVTAADAMPEAVAVGDGGNAGVDAPPIGDTPPGLDEHVERMQVWLGVNGGPMEYLLTGRCFTNRSGARFQTPLGTMGVTFAGARDGVSLNCPGAVDDMTTATRPVRFVADGGITLANASARGNLSPPSPCGDSPTIIRSFDVRGFGCAETAP